MSGYRDKVLSREELRRVVEELHRQGKTLVFTNGCFDLLHIGHIRYLYDASRLGDVLIVGINSDESVTRLKGPSRPMIPEAERAEMLAALSCVDYVSIFSEDTPDELIKLIRPNVHVKGGDYRPEDLPEAPLVKSLGGRVVIAPLVNGRSTTITITHILERHSDWLNRAPGEKDS
ncbi:MAG: D-glycero-beta-D-manno-heptose 1-phosphate adenylyltransferase [Armatimonadota bacterium]